MTSATSQTTARKYLKEVPYKHNNVPVYNNYRYYIDQGNIYREDTVNKNIYKLQLTVNKKYNIRRIDGGYRQLKYQEIEQMIEEQNKSIDQQISNQKQQVSKLVKAELQVEKQKCESKCKTEKNEVSDKKTVKSAPNEPSDPNKPDEPVDNKQNRKQKKDYYVAHSAQSKRDGQYCKRPQGHTVQIVRVDENGNTKPYYEYIKQLLNQIPALNQRYERELKEYHQSQEYQNQQARRQKIELTYRFNEQFITEHRHEIIQEIKNGNVTLNEYRRPDRFTIRMNPAVYHGVYQQVTGSCIVYV